VRVGQYFGRCSIGQCGKEGAYGHVSNCEMLPRQSCVNVHTDCVRFLFVGLNEGRSSQKKSDIDTDISFNCNWVDNRWQ